MEDRKNWADFVCIFIILLLAGLPFLYADAATEAKWKELNLQAKKNFDERKPQEALQSALDALELAKTKLDPTHPNIAKSLNNVGVLLYTQGKVEEAKSYYDQAIQFAKTNKGTEDMTYSDTLINLAKLEGGRGKYGETMTLLDQALKIREKHLGANNPQLVPLLQMKGVLYQNMGLMKEAQEVKTRIDDIMAPQAEKSAASAKTPL